MSKEELDHLLKVYNTPQGLNASDQATLLVEVKRARKAEKKLKKRVAELEAEVNRTPEHCGGFCPGCDNCRRGELYR